MRKIIFSVVICVCLLFLSSCNKISEAESSAGRSSVASVSESPLSSDEASHEASSEASSLPDVSSVVSVSSVQASSVPSVSVSSAASSSEVQSTPVVFKDEDIISVILTFRPPKYWGPKESIINTIKTVNADGKVTITKTNFYDEIISTEEKIISVSDFKKMLQELRDNKFYEMSGIPSYILKEDGTKMQVTDAPDYYIEIITNNESLKRGGKGATAYSEDFKNCYRIIGAYID